MRNVSRLGYTHHDADEWISGNPNVLVNRNIGSRNAKFGKRPSVEIQLYAILILNWAVSVGDWPGRGKSLTRWTLGPQQAKDGTTEAV